MKFNNIAFGGVLPFVAREWNVRKCQCADVFSNYAWSPPPTIYWACWAASSGFLLASLAALTERRTASSAIEHYFVSRSHLLKCAWPFFHLKAFKLCPPHFMLLKFCLRWLYYTFPWRRWCQSNSTALDVWLSRRAESIDWEISVVNCYDYCWSFSFRWALSRWTNRDFHDFKSAKNSKNIKRRDLDVSNWMSLIIPYIFQ